MYSFFPAIIAVLFLGYGLYVLKQRGRTRVTLSFFLLCFTTFSWQATWAVLFRVEDPDSALILSHVGYLMILFLPTTLYHFLVEITETHQERRLVLLSYALCSVLAVLLLTTPWIVAGTYDYFFGRYPQAGVLHPLHVLQTCVVVLRGLYITWQAQRDAPPRQRIRLRYCMASLFIYLFAAVDYLCNYGLEFYPPGVFLIFISLGLLTLATVRYQLMDVSVVISQGLARLMTLALFALLYTGALVTLQRYWPQAGLMTYALVGIVWLVLVCESYAPLRRYLQSLPDRLMHGDRHLYRYADVVQSLSHALNQPITLEALARALEEVLRNDARMAPVHLYVRAGLLRGDMDPATGHFLRWDTRKGEASHAEPLPADHSLVTDLATQPIGYFRELSSNGRRLLEAHEARCALRVSTDGAPLALVLIGRQDGFPHYTHTDLDLLELLPAQLALAFDKVQAYGRVSAGLARAGKTASLMALMNEYQHELKAPISIMHMYAQSDMDSEALRSEVLTQCRRLFALLERMVRVLHDDRQRSDRPVSLNGVVQAAVRLFPQRQAQLVLDLDTRKPMLSGDADDLLILCVNLLKNAAEATDPARPNTITLQTRLLDDTDTISLVVADTGVGISVAQQQRLSLPLESTKAGGSGLGLKVMRRIAAEHKGQVRLDSTPGTGTRVEIRLPALNTLLNGTPEAP
ncbi:ATP-binding protein [Isoalcanivorax indicus]|uniref:ATP-binding protein n=1 Tax=Isoalcanivorax indicus TaxID=2202653 RepID=UPI000DBA134F|nr:ATP-binding protein [Isoalcanivorax indicus]